MDELRAARIHQKFITSVARLSINRFLNGHFNLLSILIRLLLRPIIYNFFIFFGVFNKVCFFKRLWNYLFALFRWYVVGASAAREFFELHDIAS